MRGMIARGVARLLKPTFSVAQQQLARTFSSSAPPDLPPSSPTQDLPPSDSPQAPEVITSVDLPPVPTTCCMSGCANCVWIEYAESLVKLFGEDPDEINRSVMKNIEDPSLKAFLEMELSFRFKK